MMNRLKIAAFTLLALTVTLFSGAAYAEGSRDLVKNGGYRAYTSWDPSLQVGNIPMTTTIYVYVKAGETLSFGSSVYDNTADVAVYDPSGKKTNYDVKNTGAGAGFINTLAKEAAGPLPAAGGYSPLTVNVSQTGIWKFEFYASSSASSNPTSKRVTEQFPTDRNQGPAVAAWDVTVRDASGADKTGRVFTYYLAANVGSNPGSGVVKSDLFVLTKDGYIYKTSFNGADPWRFIFLSNNRGFIDKTNNTTLYYSPATKVQNDNTLDFIKNSGNVAVQMPNVPDTTTDVTHRLFFNYPSSDLPADIPTTPAAPAQISNFAFTGTSGTPGQSGSDGEGGQFTFTSSKSGSYQIIIDTNGDNVFDPQTDRVISNIALAGANAVFWDGKDKNGTVLSSLGTYKARIETKGGEQHFPLMDAENNADGIIIQLLNTPSDAPAGFDPYTIYYNTESFTTANGTYVNANPKSGEVAVSPRSALAGVSSQSGALKYSKGYGDMMGINIWTYFPGAQETMSFEIKDPSAIKNGFLSGYVFLDKNKDTVFNSGEPGLEGVSVNITDKDGVVHTVTTDASGHYVVNIPWGAYTVSVVPLAGYTLTTGNETQTGTLASGYVNLSDVGYYLAADLQIVKTVGSGAYFVDDTITYTLTVKNNGPASVADAVVNDSLPAGLVYVSDSAGGAYSYETGVLTVGSLSAGGEKTYTITARIIDAIEIDNIATVSSSVEDPNPGNNTSNVVITGQEKPVNNPPVAVDDARTTEVNTPVVIDVLTNDSDPDGDTLTVIDKTNGTNGTVAINPDGTVTYTPNDGFVGTDTFTYTISDGNGGTDTATVTVTIEQGNNPPVAVDDARTTEVNTPVVIDVLTNDSDPDGDTLTVIDKTNGTNGTVAINPDGTVTYTPNDGFVGTDTFTYTISDGNGGTDTATVTVTIEQGNNPPVAVDDARTTEVNTPVVIDVLTNDSDPDGDTLTVIDKTNGTNGTVAINPDGTVTYTPNDGFVGTDTFTYTISDGNGGTDTATVTVTIAEAPCVVNPGDPDDPAFLKVFYRVSNFAGTGIGGFNGHQGSFAPPSFTPPTSGELYGPRGLAADASGNLYIADEMSGTVRKVSGNVLSTITGNGKENGYTPADYAGPAYGKGMYEPMDVAVAPCNNYIVFLDTDHHIVRKIGKSGNLSTVAGVLEIGSAGGYSDGGGDALKAKFSAPQGVVIDKAGNIYVADTNNHLVRKITRDGHITNIAGTPGIGAYTGDGGAAVNAQMNKPVGLALDSKGNLYIADSGNHRIRKIDFATGIITTVAGSDRLPTNSATAEGIGDDQEATKASLYFPHDIAIDAADNLYIADSANHRIRKVLSSTGIITTIAGNGYLGASGENPDATKIQLNWPKGIAVDANGRVYISDTGNHTIKVLIP